MFIKILAGIIVFSFVLKADGQNIINFESHCMPRNSAILSKSMIRLKGEKFVTNLLNNNSDFLLFLEVDSLGKVIQIKKLQSNIDFSKELVDSLENYFIRENLSFYICFENPPGVKKDDRRKLVKNSLFGSHKNSCLINVGFPGDLITFYCTKEFKMREKTGQILSRYEYLEEQINKYLDIK